MEAHEKSFTFMNGPIRIEIPFFQRGYVWNKDNWRDLIEDLLDEKSSHFLGSIILKAIKTESGEIPRWSLIDGQQYEIGNMALLVSSLNTSIRNYEFKRKMEGEGRKAGVKKYDYLLYTKDITALYDKGDIWDETKIHNRTRQLTDEILKMW